MHILPQEQQKEAQLIVQAAKEYRDALEQFNTTSDQVINQIEDLAKQTEQKRRRALALRSLNAAQETSTNWEAALGRAKLSARQFDLEGTKLEISSYEAYQKVVDETKTAITEIFGG